MKPSEIDLVMLDGFEALALRGVLERFHLRVNLFPIGRPRHLADALSGATSHAPHLILACHGDERGILVPELAPEIAQDKPFLDVLTPELLATFVNLPGRTVVCTGCETGSEAFGRAFLQGGCSMYVAPEGYPQATAALFFVIHMYYGLLAGDLSLDEAVARARDQDAETRLFRRFIPEDREKHPALGEKPARS